MADSSQQKLRLKDRRRRLMWVKVAAGSAVVVVSLALVWYIARLPQVTIASVDVEGTTLVSADSLKALAEEKLDGSYAFLIPHRNSLVFPKRSLESAMASAFPPLAHVTISRNGFTGLKLKAEERVAVAAWCGKSPSADAGSCYSMDKDGFIFASATDASLVRFYGVASDTPIASTYLNGNFASLDALVKDISSSIQRTPATVTVDNESNDVELAFQDGGVLKFVRTNDRQATLENIASVFASQGFKTKKDFEYADFRFGDKVYVKFKGE